MLGRMRSVLDFLPRGTSLTEDVWRARHTRARAVSICLLALVLATLCVGPSVYAETTISDLTALSLEELMNVEVTTVSRKPESQMTAAAAIFVITPEAIRRSGVTSIPEALRLAPGVQVSRVDSSHWAISVRGFASTLSRSLLVLIDGRTVYSPLFAGTFWDVQDVLLEDIERIEVIRGPGGTLWGANAVNGVINIITKKAKDTQGSLAVAGGGTQERGFSSYRYGGKVGKDFSYRIYGKYFERADEAQPEFDGWRKGQGGFRTDWDISSKDNLTVQGDVYAASVGQSASLSSFTPPFSRTERDDADLNGWNVLSRWRHEFNAKSDMSLQLYYDRTNRTQPDFREFRDTFDLDFQHHIRLSSRHDFIWGLGYRLTSGVTHGSPTTIFDPPRRSDNLYSGFGQYEFALIPDQVRLTIGTKLQFNDYSGTEVQPSGRLLWTPNSRNTVWASVSRAVRVPSRVEHDLTLSQSVTPSAPTFAKISANDNFKTEKLIAYELGYRVQATDRLLLDVAGFYNRYEDLLSVETAGPVSPGPPTILPFILDNKLHGEVLGMEIAATWQALDWWRLRGSYSFLKLNLTADEGSTDTSSAVSTEESSPNHQAWLQSTMDLPGNLEFDLTPRFVGELPRQGIPNYATLDARLGWYPMQGMDISFIGRNLIGQHAEFNGGRNGRTNIQRGLYVRVTWRW
jgi:iron complex outermembrane recepter protein